LKANGKKKTYEAVLVGRSITAVFATKPGLYCNLYAVDDGLQIVVHTQPKTQETYLISYQNILTFQLVNDFKTIHTAIMDKVELNNIPDYILLEVRDDNGSIQQIQFKQERDDKQLNQKALWLNNIFAYVNARIPKQDTTITL
jgi:hypothetical protein